MILCKKCGRNKVKFIETEFDYWQWFDATENFYDPHGRFCDECGKEFEDGEIVILTEEDISNTNIF